MVGTRHPTPYGSGMAERLSTDLAARGLVIISGLARGIDTSSHRGAVAAKGKTVAVLGTGIDVMYPKRKLAARRTDCGPRRRTDLRVPVGTHRPRRISHPQPHHQRHVGRRTGRRSRGYSGTRITSRLALEQNRDVYAVPGNVTNKNSWGPNTLIKQGAKLVATWEDVWEELPRTCRRRSVPCSRMNRRAGNRISIPDEVTSPHEKKILKLLKADDPHTSINWSNCWKTKFQPRKYSQPSSSWN